MTKSITAQDIIEKVDVSVLLSRPLSDWRPVLANEVQVYVFGENYLAKRFDQINYKFCEKNEAKEILVDNLYALLRYKYFPQSSEEIDERIKLIVSNFTTNLKTTLKKVSFDKNTDSDIIHMLPDYCLAFRNGVFDFKKNDWLFKYTVTTLDKLANKIYEYDTKYAVLWYLDYNFEPLPLDIMNMPFTDFVDIIKQLSVQQKNYCFELLYNISHDVDHLFSIEKFKHLCEVLGYTCLQSFAQYFVILIGSGQNGKNSLFDGCFTNRVIPRPASNDMDAIENDRFITGSLENKAHNIFLETEAKTYVASKMIKALTGSMYQTIESKGVSKYSGIINCKYIFAGNDQEAIKFTDTTKGFRRRINVFEISYTWDPAKRFLKKGDYYDTSFSDSLVELKDDLINTTTYVYFAMYGIMLATNGFTRTFTFNHNDWNMKYSDVNMELKDNIERISLKRIVERCKTSGTMKEMIKKAFYDEYRTALYRSSTVKQFSINSIDDLLAMFEDPSLYTAYFAENDIYISLRVLQTLCNNLDTANAFTASIKKIYNITNFDMMIANIPYLKCTFSNGRLKILNA